MKLINKETAWKMFDEGKSILLQNSKSEKFLMWYPTFEINNKDYNDFIEALDYLSYFEFDSNTSNMHFFIS